MDKPILRRSRIKYSDTIKKMRVGGHLYLENAKPASIKSIACRLGDEMKRIYYTQSEANGVSVWRET